MGLPFFNSKRDRPNRSTNVEREILPKKKKYVPVAQRARGRKRRHGKSNHTQDSFSDRIRKRVNFSLKKMGMSKNLLVFMFLGYTEEDLYNHLRKYLGRRCEVCRHVELTLKNSNIDHILPVHLCRTVEDVKKFNSLTNLRVICQPCNQKKGGSYTPMNNDDEENQW